jgi:FlaA1/EpsC-like NDP-sugar epimerase
VNGAFWLEADSCWSLHLDAEQAEILLGRTPQPISLGECRSSIRGRTVLVTGAGGFIGSELCRTLARLQAGRIVALDAAENSLAKLVAELERTAPAPRIQAELCDVRDLGGLREIFRVHQPSQVYHAAAYKHVPLLEGLPFAAIENNALATWHLARLAAEFSVERFVLVSSDKAAAAANILGVSKRLAELFTAAASAGASRFTAVRCGNVLGSPGSVLPSFVEQARAGGPLTVCHEAAERYFMTVEEAAHAILEAGHITAGADIFVPDMGLPLGIVELARRVIAALPGNGRKPPSIEFTQLRAGDQIKEQLIASGEQALPATCRGLLQVRPRLRPDLDWDSLAAELTSCCRDRNLAALHDCLTSVKDTPNAAAFVGAQKPSNGRMRSPSTHS